MKRVDRIPIEMNLTLPSTSSGGTQTCPTNPQAFPSGIPTINISPITKDRLAARILQLKELAQKIGEACRAPGKKLVGAVAKLQGSAG